MNNNNDILMIYDDISISNATVYYETEHHVYLHFKALGPLYDISLRKCYKNDSSYVISKELLFKFQSKIQEVLYSRLQWKNMLLKDFDNEIMESDNDLLNRQALMFISLIIENHDMKRCSNSLIEASPALHAIRQCFLTGWRPQNLPLKFIYILLASLNNSGNVHDIFNIIAVTKEIIEMIIFHIPDMKHKVMIALLRLLDETSTFGLYQVSLLLECSDFLSHSFIHEILKAIIKENDITHSLRFDNNSNETVDFWRNKLSLGDNIEVKVNSLWFTGIIVKIDSVKETVLIEYQDKSIMNTTSISRTSDNIRQIKGNVKEALEDNNKFEYNNSEIFNYSSLILSLVFGDSVFTQFMKDVDINLNEINSKTQILNNPYLAEVVMSIYQLDFERHENINQSRPLLNNSSSVISALLSSFKGMLDKTLIEKDAVEIWVDKSLSKKDKEIAQSDVTNENSTSESTEKLNIALKVYDILAITVFQYVIREIILLFEEYIDQVLEKKVFHNASVELALQIINKISCSDANLVLVPFLYRNLFFRYKIHLQQHVTQVLKDPSFYVFDKRIDNFRKAILDIKEIEKPYSYLLKQCCSDNLNATFLVEKLECITKTYGTGRLADHILDNARINCNSNDGIQGLIHNHILMTTSRFSSDSKRARNFIRILSDFVSPKYNEILCNIWISVLAEVVIKTCSKIKLNDIVAPNEVVDNLLDNLVKAREISQTDMANLNNSGINADLAFSAAFKRLSKEFAIKIAKALAVRISKLLDSLKFGINYSESYNFSINQMADLIQVLCNDSSEDFEHYYEILLARRLLWGRYMSTQNEKHVLKILPAMTKSFLMINDIEKTSEQMTIFRKFLMSRLDQRELEVHGTLKALVFDTGKFDVHVLAGTVWQSVLVSPVSYSTLKLDPGISAIYNEYETFFKLRDISLHEAEAIENLHSFPSITISAVDEPQNTYLGTYEPSIESSNGFPLYSHVSASFILEYSIKRKAWEMKSKINRGSERCIAFFNCESFTAVPQSWLTYSSWLVKKDDEWKSTTFNIILGQRHQMLTSQLSITEMQIHKFKPTKRLHWCHAAGSAILKANLNDNKFCYVFASAPIATMLLIYNNSKKIAFTKKELCDETGLLLKEIEDIVLILSNSNLGILEKSESSYRLSQRFLSGCLGGEDIDDPIKIPLIQMPDLLSTDSLSSVHGWRNELIDASIVRLLKDIAKQKTGEFHNKDGVPHSAIPQDVLILLVKEDLVKRMHVDSKDVMRRGERLVSIGVIEKISLSTNTFRSVAYAYLPEIESDRSTNASTAQLKTSKAYDKVIGDELYGHLRVILRIRTLPVGCPGISRESFIRNFILWIAYTPCRLPFSFDKPILGFFKDTLHEYLQIFYIQKDALKNQHQEGLHERSDENHKDDDEFKRYTSKIKYHYSNPNALINFSLNYHRILFEYLPSDVMIRIVKAFRKMHLKKTNDSEKETRREDCMDTPNWDQMASIPLNKLGFYLHPAIWCHIEDGRICRRDNLQNFYSNRRNLPDPPVFPSPRPTYDILGKMSITAAIRNSRFSDSSSASIKLGAINNPPISDIDSFEDSKGDDNDEFSLNFDSFVRAIFLATLPSESKSCTSFGELLMNFLYIDVRNFTNEIFEGMKSIKESGLAPKFSTTDESEGLLLPCEICNDSFPISQLDRHQRLCSAIMRGAAGGIEALINPSIAKSPKEKKNPSNQEKLESKWSDDNLLSLIESLFNLLITEFRASYVDSNDEFKSIKDDQSNGSLFFHIRPSLETLFSTLDINADGFLSSDDFVSKMSLKVDSIDVDPVRLYSPDRKGNNDNNPFSEDKNDLNEIKNTDLHEEDEDFVDVGNLSLFPSFERVDSLWASVSHDQIVPNVTSTKSLKGLDETELEMHSILERTCDIINESEGTTTALLLHYKWDEKTLVEDYIENQIAVRLVVGLGPKTHPPFLRFDIFGRRSLNNKIELLNSACIDCGICGEKTNEDEMFALNCCHWYCQNCWENYLRIATTDREVKVSCPCSDCKLIVTLDMIKFLCKNDLYIEARKLLVKAFVEEKRDRKVIATYCKNPIGCNGVLLMAEDANCTEATCSLCASTYCFVCDLPPHAPVPCDLLADWEQRGGYLETGQDADMEARKIKQLTTKPCPKCGTRIEKNGGCPHMSCKCKYQFCWECGGDYHTSVSCTRTKVVPDVGSILHFDQMDKDVANHFLARKVAIKGKAECMKQLSMLNQNYTSMLRIKIEGWDILSKAQSALAHSCMLRFFLNSTKLEFVYDSYKKLAQDLQRKFEETWVSNENFPEDEAKIAIKNLKSRLNDYLLDINTELNPTNNYTNITKSAIRTSTFDTSISHIFGNAFS